ncbi:MAG: YjfB family protein [Eubacterium sp.]|nr:YjfB family protein [Eubacterium sp.]
MELGDGMDVAAYSMMYSQSSTMSAVSTGILAKTMEAAEIQGEQLTKMMEQSVNPGLGRNIDILL